MNKCKVCGIEVSEKATTCSPKCRKILSRHTSVTGPGVTLASVTPEIEFEYTLTTYDLNMSQPGRKPISQKRTARYWYDIPLSAKPVIKKDWPKMPDFMNGRQYFLWWKNEFATGDPKTKGEPPYDGPVLYNPFQ